MLVPPSSRFVGLFPKVAGIREGCYPSCSWLRCGSDTTLRHRRYNTSPFQPCWNSSFGWGEGWLCGIDSRLSKDLSSHSSRSWRARHEVAVKLTNDRWHGSLNDTDAFSGMHTTDSSVSGVFRLRISGLPHTHGERPEVSPTVTSTAGSDRARRRRRERGEHANIRLVCLPCITMHCPWIKFNPPCRGSTLRRFNTEVTQRGSSNCTQHLRTILVVVTDMTKSFPFGTLGAYQNLCQSPLST